MSSFIGLHTAYRKLRTSFFKSPRASVPLAQAGGTFANRDLFKSLLITFAFDFTQLLLSNAAPTALLKTFSLSLGLVMGILGPLSMEPHL